jgi:hypothetical protein
MQTTVKRCTLLEETYKTGNKEDFQKGIEGYVNLLNELTKTDLDSLTNKEYYDLLSKFYTIRFEGEDFLKAFSVHNNKKYTGFEEIKTDMVIQEKSKEGFGNYVAWSNKKQKVSYIAAVSDINTKSDPNREYTKAEIKELVDSNDIVIVNVKKTDIPKLADNSEEYEAFPVVDINGIESDFFKANIPLFGRMLREEITEEKLRNDIIKFLNELNFQLRTVTIFNKGIYQKTNEECKKWWIQSPLKEEYDNIEEDIRRTR